MDILKKMFGLNPNENNSKKSSPSSNFGNEFRKPAWFDDCETDDELFDSNKVFGFQIFTNPLEMQKHFERQMQEMLKSLENDNGNHSFFDENIRENYLRPGFEDDTKKEMDNEKNSMDTDLDDEIYADQLHTLLQRISPDIESLIPSKSSIKKQQEIVENIKKTDDEIVWDRIHGTDDAMNKTKKILPKEKKMMKIPHARGGVFEGAFQGPKIFRQSIMTQTIRKPDGTYETRRVVRDADGNTNTTVTITREGKTETISTHNNENKASDRLGSDVICDDKSDDFAVSCDRNIYVTKAGYAMPKNLW